MPEFGKFSQLVFSNGGAPAINDTNLNELERVVALTDAELAYSNEVHFKKDKEYYLERNTKDIIWFYDYSDWTNIYLSQTSLSDNNTNNPIGNVMLQMDNLLNTAGYMSIHAILGSTIDLTKFIDGSASGTNDLINFWFYVSDANFISSLQIRIGDDFANCYYIDIIGWVTTGWNNAWIQKSSFSTVGAPTGWNSIDYVRIAPYAQAGYLGEYIYFMRIDMMREDAVYAGWSNVFQKYNGSTWELTAYVLNDIIGILHDNNDRCEQIGYINYDSDANINLNLYQNLIDFRSKFEMYCKTAGYTYYVSWYISSTNMIQAYIDSNTFYLDVTEAGVLTSNSVALDNNLLKNERVYIYLAKSGQAIRAMLYKDNEATKILEYNTSISASSDGNIYLGNKTSETYCLVTDYIITNRKIENLASELMPKMVLKREDQSLTSTTLVDIDDMCIYLPPWSAFKIDLFLVAKNTGSATPDVQVIWTTTNCFPSTYRATLGPSLTCSDARDTNVKMSDWSYSTCQYGCEGGADESSIRESFIVTTEKGGGLIQLRCAQNVTDASNPTVICKKSWIIATPINIVSNDG